MAGTKKINSHKNAAKGSGEIPQDNILVDKDESRNDTGISSPKGFKMRPPHGHNFIACGGVQEHAARLAAQSTREPSA